MFFSFCLSPLVWFFLWLPEEMLALLFLLHLENEDFSILMKDIWSIYDIDWHPLQEPLKSVGMLW